MRKILIWIVLVAVLGAGVLGAVSNNSSIDLYTDRSEFQVGDVVSFDGRVTRMFQGVGNEVVGVQINSPLGTIAIDQFSTNGDGSFSGEVTLPDSLPQGLYSIFASSGGTIITKSFLVVDTAHRIDLSLNQASFSEGDEVIVSGQLSFDGINQVGHVIALQVESPIHGLLFIDQVETDSNGEFSIDFSLPSNVNAGDYLVFVSSGEVSAFEMVRVN